jgi:hypothetical protein
MALYIVIRQNKYFPLGTYLDRDDDGFQKCTLKPAQATGHGWVIDKRFGAIIPPTPELIAAITEVHNKGGLDKKLLARLMGH